nr:transposase [Ralstonia sp. UBA689]
MSTQAVRVMGIDFGKNWFHLVGMDDRGHPLFRETFNRTQLAEFAATLPARIVAMESWPGSQYWGRRFQSAGHTVRVIPAQFVKPDLKSNKKDFNDAEAIAEAASRGTMRTVPLKSNDQLEMQATHRVRQRFIVERAAAVNPMRALPLEHGIVIPVGIALFARRLPHILEEARMACRSECASFCNGCGNAGRRSTGRSIRFPPKSTRSPATPSCAVVSPRRQGPVPSLRAPWLPQLVAAKRSVKGVTLPRGLGWSPNSTRLAANPISAASASEATVTCACS